MSHVHYGLRLQVPNAPAEWHTVAGVDGVFHPEIVTPIDELGLSEADARDLAERVGSLEFVEVPRRKLKASKEAVSAAASGDPDEAAEDAAIPADAKEGDPS